MRHLSFFIISLASSWGSAQIISGQNYQIRSTCGSANSAVSIQGSSSANGAAVVIADANQSSLAQQFRFDAVSADVFRITSRLSNKVLDVSYWGTQNGSPLIQWDNFNSSNQQFRLVLVQDGIYELVPLHVANQNRVFDLAGAQTVAGTPLQIWDRNSSCAQRFRLVNLSRRNAFTRIEAESFTSQNGFVVDSGTLGYSNTGDQALYQGIDFGPDGARSVSFSVAVPASNAGRNLELRLNSANGELIARVTISSTGGWRSFQNQSVNLTRTVTGVQNIVLVSQGDDVADVDSFVFSRSQVTIAPPPPAVTPSPVASQSRWFPGHYLQATNAVDRSGMDMSKRSYIQGNPNFVGYQVSIFWGQTEVSDGDFSGLYRQLGDAVAAARADGKKLWIRLFERSFHGGSRPRPFPQYISNAGGDYYSVGSENIWAPKLWEPFVKERFIRWAEKVAEYAAANPEIVLISNEEYTIQGSWLQAGYSGAAMDQLWRDYAARMRAKAGPCLIHVNTGWSTVWPLNYVQDKAALDPLVYTHRVGIGPTDLRKDNNQGSATLATNFGAFMFNETYAPQAGYQGQTFFTINYEWPDYNSVESPLAHLQWAYDTLKVHFIGWDPDPSVGSGMPWNWTHALSAVNSTNGLIRREKPALVP